MHNIFAVDSFQQEGGDIMLQFFSFLLSVMASVVSYYICKWLDEEE